MTSLFSFMLFMLLGPFGFFVLPASHQTVSRTLDLANENLNSALQRLPLSAELLAETVRTDQSLGVRQTQASPPYRNWDVPPPNIDARSAAVIGVRSGKIFYERMMRERLPIASLTKLATALAVIEELPLSEEVPVSRHAVSTGGDFGNLVVGETLTVHDLLRAMLIASSNDAAVALSEHISRARGRSLAELMNAKAYALQLTDTHFASVSGLEDHNNYSTAQEVASLLNTAMRQSTLADILKTDAIDIHSVDGKFSHRLVTSNKLLGRFDGVVAGKTGYTEGAGGSLAILARNKRSDDDYLVVVLGSKNEETRFDEARALIDWMDKAYTW